MSLFRCCQQGALAAKEDGDERRGRSKDVEAISTTNDVAAPAKKKVAPPAGVTNGAAKPNAENGLGERISSKERIPSKPSSKRADPSGQQSSNPADAGEIMALFRSKTWEFSNFELLSTVGTGTFGRVRVVKVRGHVDRTPFALKILKKSEVIRLSQVDHVKAEKQILFDIEHPFIVNLLTTFQDDRRLFMLLEYVNGGELFSYLRKNGRLPNEHARFYAGEIILAFQYLHKKNIIYRDLKPENVLIHASGHLKITDFGFAKVVEDRTWTLCGTPEYLAPEIIQCKGHGKAVDWWAVGILIFEMLAGYPPFFDDSPFGIYQKVLAGNVEYPRHFDVKAKDLIRRLLVADKAKRFGCLKNGAEDLKKHKWYKGMDWELLLSKNIPVPFAPAVKSADDTSMFDKYPESAEESAKPVDSKELFEGF